MTEKQGTTDWKDLVIEQAGALGLPQADLLEAVKRELIKRAASKIADEWNAEPPTGSMRPLRFG